MKLNKALATVKKPMREFRPSFSYRNPLRDQFTDSFFEALPAESGVYFMRDARRRVLYVGKAKCLRKRLSTYRNAKPGQVGENVIELLEHVSTIDWEVHSSERHAHDRENELIHALTPPYNLASCWEEEYLYIGLREVSANQWNFLLTSRESELDHTGHEIFGCFRHRQKVKAGYNALLRLIFAASNQKVKFSFPAKISRVTPPYRYTATHRLPEGAGSALRNLLRGDGDAFFALLMDQLLQNETIPAFVRGGLQEDLQSVQEFYTQCVRSNEGVRGGLRTKLVSQCQLRQRIRRSVRR